MSIQHPGEYLLKEFIEPSNLSVKKVCDATGIYYKSLLDFTRGRAYLSIPFLVKLSIFFTCNYEFFLFKQAEHQLDVFLMDHREDVERDVTPCHILKENKLA